MLFIVNRTSGRYPCDGCFPYKLIDKCGETTLWAKRIDSIEELIQFMNFVKEDLIISDSFFDSKIPTIEIYDDYRE